MCQGLSWSDRRLTGRKEGGQGAGAPPQSRWPIALFGLLPAAAPSLGFVTGIVNDL